MHISRFYYLLLLQYSIYGQYCRNGDRKYHTNLFGCEEECVVRMERRGEKEVQSIQVFVLKSTPVGKQLLFDTSLLPQSLSQRIDFILFSSHFLLLSSSDLFNQLKPEYIAPVVAWLCHESCEENGGVFESAGGYVGKYRWSRAAGKAFIPPTSLTIESVRDSWTQITDMKNSSMPASVHGPSVPNLLIQTSILISPSSLSHNIRTNGPAAQLPVRWTCSRL